MKTRRTKRIRHEDKSVNGQMEKDIRLGKGEDNQMETRRAQRIRHEDKLEWPNGGRKLVLEHLFRKLVLEHLSASVVSMFRWECGPMGL